MIPTEGMDFDRFEPVAPRTGPFGFSPFLTAAERHAGSGASVVIAGDGRSATPLAIDGDGDIRFAGVENLTDYHTPLGIGAADTLAGALEGMGGSSFRFDSLPVEAAAVVDSALTSLGLAIEPVQHESTAVLDLPDSHEEWLASLRKKERHEVRRKRRRFEAEFGEIEIVRSGPEAIGAFCTMHRGSIGQKGRFMTDDMEAFFLDLLVTADASIHNLVCGGSIRASAFGFETETGYFYYNSAYDPDAALASPGIVLLSSLVEQQIERGAEVFDFLKGDEAYKYRHGAVARPLYVFEGTLP